jgi:hypothetical protein
MTQTRPPEQASKQPLSAVSEVHSLLSSLLLAMKMFSLYAEDHAHCQRAIARLHGEIEKFLQKHEALVLEVKEDQLLYMGEVVHQGLAKDGELAFALFRDGIMSLAFLQGLEREETHVFVKILDRYKSLPTGAEGDIVTALWEAEMPHLEYQAVDNILESDGTRESSSEERQDWLQSLSPGGQESLPADDLEIGREAHLLPAHRGINLPVTKSDPLPLTMEEAHCLGDMVRAEEARDATQEILNMLSDILKQQQDEDFFSYVLDFMVEELYLAFGRKDFEVALKILKTLNYIRKLCQEAGPWALSRIRKFLLRISEPDFLDGLKDGWAKVGNAQLAQARDVLLFMPPDAILQLGVMLPEVPVPVRTILSDVIPLLAARDIRPFQELLEAADEGLLSLLVPLLVKMEGERSAQLLLKMIHHPAEKVRKEALKAVILRRLWVPEGLAPLLNDENDYIRLLVVRYLSSRKSAAGEALLIEHLKRAKFSKNNGAELIACFKALGKCGTMDSVPFLRETLLKGSWVSRFRESTRRRGAAIALAYLKSEDSRMVLDKASHSRFPGVRNAAQTVYRRQGD